MQQYKQSNGNISEETYITIKYQFRVAFLIVINRHGATKAKFCQYIYIDKEFWILVISNQL